MAEQLRLGDRVVIEGWVPDPRPYLREAGIYVLPSLQEGSGSVSLIEALQAGVAVVASNIDGIPEDVIAKFQPDHFAKALREFGTLNWPISAP